MIFLFCNRHIKLKYNMFKIKRNYKLEHSLVLRLLRSTYRYSPCRLRYVSMLNKHTATEAKYQPYEI